MSVIRDGWAKWRRPLLACCLLVGGGAALGAGLPQLAGRLPAGTQGLLLRALPLLPGIERGLVLGPEDERPVGVLRVLGSERPAVRFPEDEAAWQDGGLRVEGSALSRWLAAWGAGAGLLLFAAWGEPLARRVLGGSAVLGLVTGLLLAASLGRLPSAWTAAWMRGLSGLPGLEERVQLSIGPGGETPVSWEVRSAGGLAFAAPAGEPPWPEDEAVRVTARGRAWCVAFAGAAWLAALTWAAALRVRREWWRWPLFASGLALLVFLALPFLPVAASSAWAELARRLGEGEPPRLAGLLLMERTRLGHDVGLGMAPVLLAAASALLLPVAVLTALGHAVVRRVGVRREGASAPGRRLPLSLPLAEDGADAAPEAAGEPPQGTP